MVRTEPLIHPGEFGLPNSSDNYRDNGTFANETSLTARVVPQATPVIFAGCSVVLRASPSLVTITSPRKGGVGFTGYSGRRTAEACAASATIRKLQTAARFITTIFIYINHVAKGKYKIRKPGRVARERAEHETGFLSYRAAEEILGNHRRKAQRGRLDVGLLQRGHPPRLALDRRCLPWRWMPLHCRIG